MTNSVHRPGPEESLIETYPLDMKGHYCLGSKEKSQLALSQDSLVYTDKE